MNYLRHEPKMKVLSYVTLASLAFAGGRRNQAKAIGNNNAEVPEIVMNDTLEDMPEVLVDVIITTTVSIAPAATGTAGVQTIR